MIQKLTKYENEIGSAEYTSLLTLLSIKPFKTWRMEHEQRMLTAALMMENLGIDKKIYEFHDADFIGGVRIKTFSDALLGLNHETTIVSKQLETGNFDGMNTIHSEIGPFGELFEYVTKQDIMYIGNSSNNTDGCKLSYSVIDSIIFDNHYPRDKNYIMTAFSLGKACYLPITGYTDSISVKKELDIQDRLVEEISEMPGINIKSFESTIEENNSFVKVLKISKGIVK